MSLDIMLTSKIKASPLSESICVSFDGGDADYCYLWQAMMREIKEETRELIDLYDDAEFSGDNLHKVEIIISKQIN